MTPLSNFINGETDVDFDRIQTTSNFDLEHALDDWGWGEKDLVEIMMRLRTADDFEHFMWVAKNIVSRRIEDLTGTVSDICSAVTK